jgi:hypothetical protein
MEVGPGRFELVAATQSVTAIKGVFGKFARLVSVKDMNETIAAAGARVR